MQNQRQEQIDQIMGCHLAAAPEPTIQGVVPAPCDPAVGLTDAAVQAVPPALTGDRTAAIHRPPVQADPIQG